MKLLIKFLILSFIVSCSHTPNPPKLDLDWIFILDQHGNRRACLGVDDILKINEMRINKCEE